jgi:hypothetical protein
VNERYGFGDLRAAFLLPGEGPQLGNHRQRDERQEVAVKTPKPPDASPDTGYPNKSEADTQADVSVGSPADGLNYAHSAWVIRSVRALAVQPHRGSQCSQFFAIMQEHTLGLALASGGPTRER